MIPAVPAYLGNQFTDAPPGHRFGLYFPIWNEHTWALEKTRKSEALKSTLALPVESRKQIDALRSRQQALVALAAEGARLSLEAEAISPLATGMGMEHPLENGFAFLNPYGLPYLPGSSIKGVLRRAAEELAKENHDGWSKPTTIEKVFGSEDANNASRGALTFWDAIPELAGNSMGMDVMTPHYGDYYHGNRTPHDAGSPHPIVFMVIPAKSKFSFHVTADTKRLKGVENWQVLMQAAFDHAFKWLGFGAKTSVGYGAMQDPAKKHSTPVDITPAAIASEPELWAGAHIKFNRANGTLSVEKSGKAANALKPKGEELLNTLPAAIKQKVMGNQYVKVNAYVQDKDLVQVEPV